MSRVEKNQMRATRALRMSPLVWLLALGACTSVLGIEDLHEGPRDGETGGSDNTTSGKTNSAGKNNNSGGSDDTGGTTGSGGKTGAGGKTSNNGGTGNVAADAGMGNVAADGGAPEGGAPNPAGPVHGKVIDRWGMPVANVTVQIGAEQVSTSDDGTFTVKDAAGTYDASLLIEQVGWVYQDLTRRDPTLQVYSALNSRDTWVQVGFKNGKLGTNEVISVAFGTPTGTTEDNGVGTDDTFPMTPDWDGGPTTSATGHSLYWTINPTTKLPVSYKGYDAQAITLNSEIDTATMTFDLAAKVIAGKAVTGTAVPYGQGDRHNSVFMRFTSGASIQVVDDQPAANAFTYMTPTLATSSITFAAWEGSPLGPLGLIHKDGLKPGDAVGTLDIPAPPRLTKPLNLAKNVDPTGPFVYQPSADNSGTFVVTITMPDAAVHVVTHRTSFPFPNVVDNAFVLTAGVDYYWYVETHGSFKTVDEMTGPTGFVDDFSKNYVTPVGSKPASGTYTSTAEVQFNVK
jgi:hypothetical protein